MAAAAVLGASHLASAQYVRLDRCKPAEWKSGEAFEVQLEGGGLEEVSMWTSFPATIERLEEKAPRFRITTNHVGPGAVRAHSKNGVSNLVFVTVGRSKQAAVASASKTVLADAQELQVPVVLHGKATKFAAHYFRFTCLSDDPVVIHALARGSDFDGVITLREGGTGRRLKQADDGPVHGVNPWLLFTPKSGAEYVVELQDSEYRDQPYELRIAKVEPPPALAGIRHEEKSEPQVVASFDVLSGVLEKAGDVDAFAFSVPERAFYRVTPMVRAVQSPVTPRIKILKPDGGVLVQTPAEAFGERELMVWLDKGEGYQVSMEDALGQHGPNCRYQIAFEPTNPFELTVPPQREKRYPLHDKFLVVPGGLFEVPVHVRRTGYNEAIELALVSEQKMSLLTSVIPAGKNDANLRVQVPANLEPGSFHSLRFVGKSQQGERSYEVPLGSKMVLVERDPGALIPESVDGVLAVRVLATPFEVKVEAPEEVTLGQQVKLPVTLEWRPGRKFNTTLSIVGAPSGVQVGTKNMNDKTVAENLDLKVDNKDLAELKDLKVQVRVNYHNQTFFVESAPFSIRIAGKDDEKN